MDRRFVDWDMAVRHYGNGVGHVGASSARVAAVSGMKGVDDGLIEVEEEENDEEVNGGTLVGELEDGGDEYIRWFD